MWSDHRRVEERSIVLHQEIARRIHVNPELLLIAKRNLVRPNGVAAINVKATVMPIEHVFDHRVIYFTLSFKHFEHFMLILSSTADAHIPDS